MQKKVDNEQEKLDELFKTLEGLNGTLEKILFDKQQTKERKKSDDAIHQNSIKTFLSKTERRKCRRKDGTHFIPNRVGVIEPTCQYCNGTGFLWYSPGEVWKHDGISIA